jgi:integrase
LEAAVPKTPRWRYAALPRSLSAAEIERVIDSVNTDSRAGLRDSAILLLLARMGRRAVEISEMARDDIYWRSDRLWKLSPTTGKATRARPADRVLAFLDTL